MSIGYQEVTCAPGNAQPFESFFLCLRHPSCHPLNEEAAQSKPSIQLQLFRVLASSGSALAMIGLERRAERRGSWPTLDQPMIVASHLGRLMLYCQSVWPDLLHLPILFDVLLLLLLLLLLRPPKPRLVEIPITHPRPEPFSRIATIISFVVHLLRKSFPQF
jgi:hypothetical protein